VVFLGVFSKIIILIELAFSGGRRSATYGIFKIRVANTGTVAKKRGVTLGEIF